MYDHDRGSSTEPEGRCVCFFREISILSPHDLPRDLSAVCTEYNYEQDCKNAEATVGKKLVKRGGAAAAGAE